ncbi:MAG TPA: (Fe-S)-binding protein [Methanotrichaceae archaeon]|nr:(Fe-S)-binding protein [Methanotrichaceae archaeon]
MSESDKILERCIECGLCVKECDFLQRHCESPRDLAESFKAGKHRTSPEIPYSCNLCGLCEVRCPEGLNVGKMCFEARHQLVQEGLAPLKQHQPLRAAQDWYVSDEFRLVLPSSESLKSSEASGSGETIRTFFPGCALSAYSPDLVIKTYEYLLQKLPGTGIVLGCCGAPAYLIGDQSRFQEIIGGIESDVKGIGASEIIVACPCCYLVLKQYLPHLNPISLYTVLARIGLPEAKPAAGAREKRTFSIHDPCSSRFEGEVHNSVRKLIEACGHEVEEIEHSMESSHCCGLGGMAFAVDADLSAKKARHTIDESRSDLVTYCASCRGHLASQGAHILHLLDLIFNDDQLEDRFAPAADLSEAIENQRQLKLRLLNVR